MSGAESLKKILASRVMTWQLELLNLQFTSLISYCTTEEIKISRVRLATARKFYLIFSGFLNLFSLKV